MYKFWYLIWLLPVFVLFLCLHQAYVFFSVVDTYENGESYVAEVVDYEMKQIVTQNSGYIVLKFETEEEIYQQKLSLPVEMASIVSESRVVPIRFKKDSFVNIVMTPAYGMQKDLVLTNLGMAVIGFFITLFIAFLVHRHATKKLRDGDQKIVIERVDNA